VDNFASAASIVLDGVSRVKPPRRERVCDVAERAVWIQAVGGPAQWRASVTPYMIEPMNLISSRTHEAVVFCGPSRSGKTIALCGGGIAHQALCNPLDMAIYLSTEENAKAFSHEVMHRIHKYSCELRSRLSKRAADKNIYAIRYADGMSLSLLWPSSGNVSQRGPALVMASDYDSVRNDQFGEGDFYTLIKKRVAAWLSAGMVVIESSPKRSIIGKDWAPKTKHEFPPTDGGVVALYNSGDRRGWYWRCLHCREFFEAPRLPDYDENATMDVACASARVVCPECGGIHRPDDKAELQRSGKWIPDTEGGSKIASFRLFGTAAAFQSWSSLVRNNISAIRSLEKTGSEDAIRATTNTDQGYPYRVLAMRSAHNSEELRTRAEWWPVREVPEGVRYITIAVDVQKDKFVVSAIGRGVDGERWIIDRHFITESTVRTDVDGTTAPINPASYQEDWAALSPLVGASYPLADGSGRRMRVRIVVCDSGGAAGKYGTVTERAYAWWRTMYQQGNGQRVRLIKGEAGADGKPGVRMTSPESKLTKAQGPVPLYWANSISLKDSLDSDLHRRGMIHIPEWADEEVFQELCAEVRGARRWEKTGPNEQWDLLVYEAAAAQILEWDAGSWRKQVRIDWAAPPSWAKEWDSNPMVFSPGVATPVVLKKEQRASKPILRRGGYVGSFNR
jgi:phage terminase large subunit GpA-like protein